MQTCVEEKQYWQCFGNEMIKLNQIKQQWNENEMIKIDNAFESNKMEEGKTKTKEVALRQIHSTIVILQIAQY